MAHEALRGRHPGLAALPWVDDTSVADLSRITTVAECWIQPAVDLVSEVPGVGSVEITVLNGEELSYARSVNAPILDLQYLSTRVA